VCMENETVSRKQGCMYRGEECVEEGEGGPWRSPTPRVQEGLSIYKYIGIYIDMHIYIYIHMYTYIINTFVYIKIYIYKEWANRGDRQPRTSRKGWR